MHQGKPRWNGKSRNVTLTSCLLPFVAGRPLCLQLENCEDFFLPIFEKVEDLRVVMAHLKKKTAFSDYTIKQITDPHDFLDFVREGGIRIMLNPCIINDHHTKWLEVVREGEEYLFMEATNEE